MAYEIISIKRDRVFHLQKKQQRTRSPLGHCSPGQFSHGTFPANKGLMKEDTLVARLLQEPSKSIILSELVCGFDKFGKLSAQVKLDHFQKDPEKQTSNKDIDITIYHIDISKMC